ncbi:hypothetical protein [Streptomyces antibioticus]|uniref:hypothetical protein n=1 Tax=Streptomyces antibioticus TaxID=1890 RepID=UPI00117FDD32|nr:hypothetical protein [Streptomyces antibioticus]
MPGVRGASVIAVMGGILALTGCQEALNSPTGSGTPASASSSSALSSSSSAQAPTPTGTTPTTSSPTPTGTPTAGPATTTPAPSGTIATPVKATTPTPAAPHPPSADHADCRNLTAGSQVKAAVTEAYRRSFPRFVHIGPDSGTFFYGQCGGVRYAATRFHATPGATHDELVNMQDEGSVTKYFRSTSAGGWTYLTSDGFPHGPQGCGDVAQIPEALSALWGNCSVG